MVVLNSMMNLEESIYKQLNRPTKRLLSQKIKWNIPRKIIFFVVFTFFSVESYNLLKTVAKKEQKKFLIFQGGQWFVDQLWERWNQWVKNGSQWTSNYNLEINGPLAPPTNFLKVTKEWIGSNTSFSWGAS